MENIFDKDVWSQEDRDIYFNNINILREYNHLSKTDFNKKIGVRNAFRSDQNKPGRGTVLTICKEFDIDENWLGNPQKEMPQIKEHNKGWEKHGGWKRSPLGSDWEMAGKALSVLLSDTPYGEILATNINIFYKALQKEEGIVKKNKKKCDLCGI